MAAYKDEQRGTWYVSFGVCKVAKDIDLALLRS